MILQDQGGTLRIEQRALARKEKGSNNWIKQVKRELNKLVKRDKSYLLAVMIILTTYSEWLQAYI